MGRSGWAGYPLRSLMTSVLFLESMLAGHGDRAFVMVLTRRMLIAPLWLSTMSADRDQALEPEDDVRLGAVSLMKEEPMEGEA